MKRLVLMRHAKSAWSDAGQKDHDRPLAPRGRRSAPVMGAWLAEFQDPPQLVLCSTAARTSETLDLMKPSLPKGTAVRHDKALYLASSRDLLSQIVNAPEKVDRLMLMGHNPGIGDLALTLAGSGDIEALNKLRSKFPTAAIAILEFGAENWSDIAPGQGKLRAFLRPRDRA